MNFFSSDGSHPFKVGADRIQLIAKKVLNTLLPFPKKNASSQEGAESALLDTEHFVTPTQKLNQLIAVNNLFCSLLESPDVFALSVSRSGVILDISPSVGHVLGYKPEQLTGINGAALVHPDDLENLRHFEWDGKTGKGLQLRCKTSQDEWKWVRFILLQGQDEGADNFFLMATTLDQLCAEENVKKEKALQAAASGIEASLNKWRSLMGLAQSPQTPMDPKSLIHDLEEIAAHLEALLDDLKRQSKTG